MAPNLLLRPALVRGECDNVKNECDEKNTIRTDFIVQNIYSHLMKDSYEFDCMNAANINEETVMKELQEIVDEFKISYDNAIKSLCSEIEATEETMDCTLYGIANELFCDGINWSKIVSFFVFVSELSLQFIHRAFPENILNVVYECFCRLVKEKLQSWIDDHGGWEGVRCLSKPAEGFSNEELIDQDTTSDKGWAKSILHNTVRMIGTLAHIANNSSGQTPP